MKNYPKNLKAILIDLDGTFVDSLSALWECYKAFLEHYSVTPSLEEFKTLLAPSLQEIVQNLQSIHSLPGSADDLYKEYWSHACHSYNENVVIFEDAMSILTTLKAKGLKIALVTSAPIDLVDIVIRRFGLRGFFDALITSSTGDPAKPSPALYKRTLETLNLSPSEAMAVEDSVSGVKSAMDAGLYTIQFIPQNSPSSKSKEASIFAESWSQIGEIADGYQTFRVPVDFRPIILESEGGIRLSDLDRVSIERVWKEAEMKRGKHLYNGKLFNFESFNKGELKGFFIEYKLLIASRALQDDKFAHKISPLAMSCICFCENKVLLGRRSSIVTDHPNFFELPPSGGIDTISASKGFIDLTKQAIIELEEETDIREKSVKNCYPILLIKDLKSHMFEICMLIELHSESLKLSSTDEYSMLEWKNLESLKIYASTYRSQFVPLSCFLIEHYLEKLLFRSPKMDSEITS